MPAVAEAKNFSQIYPVQSGSLKNIHIKNQQKVKKGDLLFDIRSSELENRILVIQKELEILKIDSQKLATDKKILSNRFVLEESILKKQQELQGLLELKSQLKIKAPFDGIVYFNDKFKIGQYVNKKESIATIYDPQTINIVGYCNDKDYKYLDTSAQGKFISDIANIDSLKVQIESISNISQDVLKYEELSSIYGGNIAVRQDMNQQNNNELISQDAYFIIETKVIQDIQDINIRTKGELIVNSDGSSFLTKIFKSTYNILVKESGF